MQSTEITIDSSGAKGRWRPIALIATIVVVLVAAPALGIGDRLLELREWIAGLGAWGPWVFVGLYIVAVVAALPGSAITLVAGALFGSVVGIAVVSAGSTIGAGLSFLIARYFARDAAARWLMSNEKFRRLDQMTEKHGAIIVALTRLVPIFPFNLINYGFGLTRVRFGTYLFWSWLCMLPATAVFVVGADAVTAGFTSGRIPWGLVLAAVGLATVLVVIVRQARQRLATASEGRSPR